jgi:hypothetical protein
MAKKDGKGVKGGGTGTSTTGTTTTTKGGRATEKDVLMGRGKRVSEWPGNIYFRQVVNKHREPYHDAERSKKVYTAQAVIAAIHDIGGRFLKEESDGSWTEIEHPRSIEKTCQALREKEKPNPPMLDPFDGADFPNGPPPQKKQKQSHKHKGTSSRKTTGADGVSVTGGSTTESDDDDDEDGKSDDDDDDSSLETDTDGSDDDDDDDDDDTDNDDDGSDDDDDDEDSQIATNGVGNNKKNKDNNNNGNNTPATCQPLPAPLPVPAWQHDDMLRSLETFKGSYGNCAVPPGWTKDEELADWCTVQRQHYREVSSGYREATPPETNRFKNLTAMGFCWDYDNWHWEEHYRALAKWYQDLVVVAAATQAQAQTQAQTQAQQQQSQQQEAVTIAAGNNGTNNNNNSNNVAKTCEDQPPPPTVPTVPPERELVDWLQDQRRQYRDGQWLIPMERVERLRQIGVSF